ncbi:MAG: DNA-processing protein DprA, partial [Muribaculaceae bacterium]|nr:DNA-processing protein DprA [Muribaculaceae bacterium]
MDDLLTLRIAFSFLRGMNVTLGRELLRLCGSEERFFAMSESELRNLTHSSAEVYSKDYRAKVLAKAEAEALFVRSHSVGTLYFTDEDYPQRLLDCDDAPVLIYSSGQTDLNHCQAIGIVGTRHATPYGADFTRRLVQELAQKLDNPVIISGLAYGIDIAAHRAALEAGIPTVAVMATAISSIYPAEHRASAVDIVRSSGMLLTEYSSRRVIHRANFLERNRVVAGMSDCLIVSESAEKGGALVTAQLAADYNRDVFAVPGRVNDR